PQSRGIAAAAAHDDGLAAAEVDHRGGRQGTGPAVDDRSQLVTVAVEYLLGVVKRILFAFGDQGGGNQGRRGGLEQVEGDLVVGHAYADGFTGRMGHPARY